MWKFDAEDKVFQIGRVKMGGKLGYAPPVLIGTLFYNKHYIVKDEMKGGRGIRAISHGGRHDAGPETPDL